MRALCAHAAPLPCAAAPVTYDLAVTPIRRPLLQARHTPDAAMFSLALTLGGVIPRQRAVPAINRGSPRDAVMVDELASESLARPTANQRSNELSAFSVRSNTSSLSFEHCQFGDATGREPDRHGLSAEGPGALLNSILKMARSSKLTKPSPFISASASVLLKCALVYARSAKFTKPLLSKSPSQ